MEAMIVYRDVATWLPIVGYEGAYEVSRDGRVRSLTRMVRCGSGTGYITGREMKTFLSADGRYPTVKLSLNGKKKSHLVHRLMLEAFDGPCPPGLEGCHRNDIPTDNRIENLRWDTRESNMRDVVLNGNHDQANKTRCNHGHEFTPENTIIVAKGRRNCRECKNLSRRRSYANGRTDVRSWGRHPR